MEYGFGPRDRSSNAIAPTSNNGLILLRKRRRHESFSVEMNTSSPKIPGGTPSFGRRCESRPLSRQKVKALDGTSERLLLESRIPVWNREIAPECLYLHGPETVPTWSKGARMSMINRYPVTELSDRRGGRVACGALLRGGSRR